MVNANWPLVSVQVAFNAGPGTTTTPTWTDITSSVQAFSGSGGRQYELDQVQGGNYNLTLLDTSEQFNPANTGSAYYPNVIPYRRLIIQAMWPPVASGGNVNLINSSGRQPESRAAYDPTFESYAVGAAVPWLDLPFNTTPVVTTAQAFQGTHSATWSFPGDSQEHVTGWKVRTIPGQQYTASAYVRQDVANVMVLFIASTGVYSTTSTATNTWVRLSATWTASQPYHDIYVGYAPATGLPALAGNMWLDAVQLETGASASAFVSAGPVIYGVFGGFIERWPTKWDLAGRRGWCAATAVDAITILAQQKLNTEVTNTIISFGPTYYWPLWDGAGTLYAAEASGHAGPPLAIATSSSGAGGGVTFGGTDPVLPGDPSETRATFAVGSNTNPAAMDCQVLDAGPCPINPSGLPIAAIPANPAVAWTASAGVWCVASQLSSSAGVPQTLSAAWVPTTGGGASMTAVSLICAPSGGTQSQPLTIGLIGTNLVWYLDPSFEAETLGAFPTYWGSQVATGPTITNTQAHDGTQSMTWTVTGGTGSQGVVIAIGSLDTTKIYTYSIWYRQTAANAAQVGYQAVFAFPATFDTAGTSTSAINTWVRLQVTFQPSHTTAYLWVNSGAPGSNSTCWVDSFQLEVGVALSSWSPYGYNPIASYQGPGGQQLVAIDTGTGLADGNAHFLSASVSQDPAANTTITLYRDQAATVTATATTASLGGTLAAGATIVQVGGQSTTALTGQSWNGSLAHVGIWAPQISSGLLGTIWYAAWTGYNGENSGSRIGRWLGYAYAGPKDIRQGQSTMGVSQVTRNTGCLAAVLQVQQSENGVLFADSDGYVQFYSRNYQFTNITPQWTLGESSTPYQPDIAYDFDPTLVYNDITVSRQDGVSVEVTNTTSMQQYGNRGLSITSYVQSDGEVIDAANYYSGRYAQPLTRLNTLTVEAASTPATAPRWPQVLGMDISDRISVTRTTSAFTETGQFFIQQRSPVLSFEGGQWQVGLQANPVDPNQPWILGDATYGVLDTTTRLSY